MRTLIVCHYFAPEPGAPQTRLSELARMWASDGDDVTVLTGFPNHPTGIVPEAYRRRTRMVERQDGYRVVRTWLYATPNERVLRKTLGHISFMVTSVVLGLRPSGPADVVVVSSPTFFSMFSAWMLAKIKRARFVVEIRDLWPAAIIELGVLRAKWIIKILEWIELRMYRAADAIVPTSQGFADDMIRRGIDAAKITVITNGVDLARFAGPDDRSSMRTRLGAGPDDVLVLYAGTHGMLYDLQLVAEAAYKLRDAPVRFAFVGEGVTKAALAARVTDLGLEQVALHDAVAAGEIPAVMSAADVFVLPLRDVPMVEKVIAAKIFEYMAAGKPVVGSLRGETADILRAAGQVVTPPEDAGALTDALRALIDDPARRAAVGEAGRRFVAANYDRHQLASRYRALLSSVVATKSS